MKSKAPELLSAFLNGYHDAMCGVQNAKYDGDIFYRAGYDQRLQDEGVFSRAGFDPRQQDEGVV